MILQIILLCIGLGLLIKGADLLVDGGSALARRHKVSDLAIGLTVIAFGTSMPELVVNTFAAFRGNAEIIDNRDLLMKMKRAYWENIPGWQENFVLIRVIPVTVEVINYRHNLNNDPKTFKAPSIKLQ